MPNGMNGAAPLCCSCSCSGLRQRRDYCTQRNANATPSRDSAAAPAICAAPRCEHEPSRRVQTLCLQLCNRPANALLIRDYTTTTLHSSISNYNSGDYDYNSGDCTRGGRRRLENGTRGRGRGRGSSARVPSATQRRRLASHTPIHAVQSDAMQMQSQCNCTTSTQHL